MLKSLVKTISVGLLAWSTAHLPISPWSENAFQAAAGTTSCGPGCDQNKWVLFVGAKRYRYTAITKERYMGSNVIAGMGKVPVFVISGYLQNHTGKRFYFRECSTRQIHALLSKYLATDLEEDCSHSLSYSYYETYSLREGRSQWNFTLKSDSQNNNLMEGSVWNVDTDKLQAEFDGYRL